MLEELGAYNHFPRWFQNCPQIFRGCPQEGRSSLQVHLDIVSAGSWWPTNPASTLPVAVPGVDILSRRDLFTFELGVAKIRQFLISYDPSGARIHIGLQFDQLLRKSLGEGVERAVRALVAPCLARIRLHRVEVGAVGVVEIAILGTRLVARESDGHARGEEKIVCSRMTELRDQPSLYPLLDESSNLRVVEYLGWIRSKYHRS